MEKYQLHYTHPDGRIVGDVMPYYFNKEYHVFYLLNGSGHNDINHEHAVSTDLVHWRNLPPSITHEDNCAFTGCYLTTKDGIHHCFFTRWNPENINGRETIGHAISKDLISWEKTDLHLIPDGVIYSSARYRDFRDPCVFYDSKDKLFHMFLLANKVGKENTASSWDENWIQGHYVSKDLTKWNPLPPLLGSFADECPDYLFENGTHYIHGCHHYATSHEFVGPYNTTKESVLDLGLRAAKMCVADKRRLWFGGFIGGSFTLPRELIVTKDKKMGLKLSKEIVEATNYLIESIQVVNFQTKISNSVAHRFQIKTSSDFSNQIIFIFGEDNKTEIQISNHQITYKKNNEIKTLGQFDKKKSLSFEIVIDNDLVEFYWCDEGSFTFKTLAPILQIDVKSTKKVIKLSHFQNKK